MGGYHDQDTPMPSGSATKSGLSALYKIRFQNGISWRGLEDSPFYLKVKKDTNFSPRHKERTVHVTPGNSSSSTFEKALTNRGPSTQVTFNLDTKPDYTIGSLTNKVMKSRDPDRIRDAFVTELDMKGYIHGQTLQRKFWGYEGGSIATIQTSGGLTNGNSYITVDSKWQAMQFHAGMVIEITTTNGTEANPSGTVYGPFHVTDVDIANKKITVAETIVATTSVAGSVHYWVLNDGDYGETFSGVLGWCPPDDPESSGDSFLSVDRAAYGDLRRLSGFRPTRTLADHTRNVAEAVAEASQLGVSPKVLYCNPMDLDAWVAEMPNAQWVSSPTMYANVNFEGVNIRTSKGTLTALGEPKCPIGIWHATRMELWTLLSLGEVPMKPGRGELMQEGLADAWQFRLISYVCLDNVDPGASITGKWATAA
jgi:hypothetical protein